MKLERYIAHINTRITWHYLGNHTWKSDIGTVWKDGEDDTWWGITSLYEEKPPVKKKSKLDAMKSIEMLFAFRENGKCLNKFLKTKLKNTILT